jgi:uncharacterized protein YciU (UPF0263 family)
MSPLGEVGCFPANADPINPEYYKRGGIELFDVVDRWQLNFNLGNALTYICRSQFKGQAIMDLRKAVRLLQREIEVLSRSEGTKSE